MIFNRINLYRGLITVVAFVCCFGGAMGVQAPNPRGASVAGANARGTIDSVDTSRAATSGSTSRAMSRGVDARAAARGVVVSRAARGAATMARGATSGKRSVVRSGGAVARSAAKGAGKARSAKTVNTSSRAGVARATAVFNDVSKIGSGYAACRDAYASCMDQFCANANDTYRRCYCSSRFTEFRDTEAALDEAKTLLARFEDNNLNAVDKTAAEVNAMYSATVGEAAIKNDTSGAAKILDEIGDLLSGKKKASKPSVTASGSLGLLSVDLSGDIDDVWSGGGSSLFSGSSNSNLANLEGVELYNSVNKQCLSIVTDTCNNKAVTDMARSSYSILITQDCNLYQKNIDKKVEAVKQTVRTAEKYLREARLEEYRSHNSADVNDCISKVRAAITADTACGENYKRCLDKNTGVYINQTTGEPIYSPRLFKLNELITLDGVDADVLKQNGDFDKFLESRKKFAATALDGCRDIASVVWDEFKRTALIEIAQAQDEKIEEVKMSCVRTIAECYDTQNDQFQEGRALTGGIAADALKAIVIHDKCKDKVLACAALYGDIDGCSYDDRTKKLTQVAGKTCGLTSLLAYVNTVDSVKVAQGCSDALTRYLADTCKPADGDKQHQYPWGCREIPLGTENDGSGANTIYGMLKRQAGIYCGDDLMKLGNGAGDMDERTALRADVASSMSTIRNLVATLKSEMGAQLAGECRSIHSEDGLVWDANGYTVDTSDVIDVSPTWLKNVFSDTSLKYFINATGVSGYTLKSSSETIKSSGSDYSLGWGICMLPTDRQLCQMQNQLPGMEGTATFSGGKCELSQDWYNKRCNAMGGYFVGNRCWFE